MPLIYAESDNAFRRLKDEIKKKGTGKYHYFSLDIEFQLLAIDLLSNLIWSVPRTSSPLFTGRETELETLGSHIDKAISDLPLQEQLRMVITGIGGQGKSDTCLRLAEQFRSR